MVIEIVRFIIINTVFTLLALTVFYTISYFTKSKKENISFGLIYLAKKVFFSQKALIIYISIIFLSVSALIISYPFIFAFTFSPIDFVYSFPIILVIVTLIEIAIFYVLILFAIKFVIVKDEVIFNIDDKKKPQYIIKDNKKVAQSIELSEIITYLRIIFESGSLVLALYIVGLSASFGKDSVTVTTFQMGLGLMTVVPYLTLKIHEQRLNFINCNKK